MVRAWLSMLVFVASCDREKQSTPTPEPARAANSYACRTPPPPRPPPTPTRLQIKNKEIALTRTTCVPGAYANGSHGGLGSWNIQVRSLDGGTCVFERMDEIEGGYHVSLCRVAVTDAAPIKLVENWQPVANGSCTLLRSGNLLTEKGKEPHETQLLIPGTNFVVWLSSEPGQLPLTTSGPNNPPVTLGATVTIAYQLYDDTAYTVASKLPGASGKLVYRHGAGEVGQAIERFLSTNSSGTARSNRMTFRAEVAQGIRDKLPAFAPDALFCADIAVMQVTAPQTPLQGPVPCATGEQWFCQLGPTSVDNTTAARGCGCGQEYCPQYGFRWTTDTGEKWPDGSHKLKYECVDDKERIRRTKEASPKK